MIYILLHIELNKLSRISNLILTLISCYLRIFASEHVKVQVYLKNKFFINISYGLD